MRGSMTNQELLISLNHLKRSINSISEKFGKKIIFYNELSFYYFIKDFPCRGKQSIEDMMNKLEPFIPLKLTQNNFELFMKTVMNLNHSAKREEESIDLIDQVKGDFVYAIQCAGSPDDWCKIIDTCESIRQMKEGKLFHTLV